MLHYSPWPVKLHTKRSNYLLAICTVNDSYHDLIVLLLRKQSALLNCVIYKQYFMILLCSDFITYSQKRLLLEMALTWYRGAMLGQYQQKKRCIGCQRKKNVIRSRIGFGKNIFGTGNVYIHKVMYICIYIFFC